MAKAGFRILMNPDLKVGAIIFTPTFKSGFWIEEGKALAINWIFGAKLNRRLMV
jgi:hypothetical protein